MAKTNVRNNPLLPGCVSLITSVLATEKPDWSGMSPEKARALMGSVLDWVSGFSFAPASVSALPLALMSAGLDPWKDDWAGMVLEKCLKPNLYPVFKHLISSPNRPVDWDGVSIKSSAEDTGVENKSPRLPLLSALAHRRRDEWLKCALEAGANPNRKDAQGYTPVAYAARIGDLEILLRAGGRIAGSGWHTFQSSHRISQKWLELVPFVADVMARESVSDPWEPWTPLVSRALGEIGRGRSPGELWKAVALLWEQAPSPLTWTGRNADLKGWPVDPAWALSDLRKGCSSEKDRKGLPRNDSVLSKWKRTTVPETISLMRTTDWSHASRPGVPDGVWAALKHWRHSAAAQDMPMEWMGSNPDAFWSGVSTVFAEWLGAPEWADTLIAVLATLCQVKGGSLPGFSEEYLAGHRAACLDRALGMDFGLDKRALSAHPQGFRAPLEAIVKSEVLWVQHHPSREGLARALYLLASPVGHSRAILDALSSAQEKKFRVTLDEGLDVQVSAIRRRLSAADKPRFEAWLLGNEMMEASMDAGVGPGKRPRL